MTTTLRFVHTGTNLTILLGARPYNIASSDSVYPEVIALVKAQATEDEILAVINRAVAAVQKATAITPNIAIQNGVVTFKGQALDNSITTRMLTMLDEGFDLVPMAIFLENLMSNPSYRAVTELYSFLEKGGMPITPDGHFMAYKAVRANYMDIHSGTFDNSIGKVCEMPRNAVDDDKNRTCSAGLHFCSFEYLPHFAHANGHVVLVKINPRDVVSIPADYNDTKGRCARYEVVGEYADYYKENGPYFTSMVFDPSSLDSDDFEVYGDNVYVDAFDSLQDAIRFTENLIGAYEEIEVRDVDGSVLHNVDTLIFKVFAEKTEMAGFTSMASAKEHVLKLFKSDEYHDIEIRDVDGNTLMSLEC